MIIDYDFMINTFYVLWAIIGIVALGKQWKILVDRWEKNVDKRLEDAGIDPKDFD